MKLLIAFLITITVLSAAFADDNASNMLVQFQGPIEQGSLVRGHVPAGSRLKLDGVDVKVSADGYFVVGFARENKPNSMYVVEMPSGEKIGGSLAIAPRQYDVERVDGLPPKTVTPPPSWTERRKVETARVVKGRSYMTDDEHWRSQFIKPASGRISGVYGSQRILNGKPRSPHYGLDIANKTGTKVVAPASGTIRLAAPDFLLEGGIIIIDHGFGVTSTLFHLNSVEVKEGQNIKQGERIGSIGATGRASGPHVDWRLNWQKVRLDPALVLK